jgi:hypothetical protein
MLFQPFLHNKSKQAYFNENPKVLRLRNIHNQLSSTAYPDKIKK